MVDYGDWMLTTTNAGKLWWTRVNYGDRMRFIVSDVKLSLQYLKKYL